MNSPKLNQITKHVYWFPPDETTDRPTLGAVVGKRSTLIMDAGNSPAHATLFLKELAQIENVAPPKYLVLTHWHWDHVFGTSVFNIPICASQQTKQIVEEMAQLDWSDEALDKRVNAGVEIEFCRDMIKKEMPDRHNLHLKPPDIAFSHQLDIDLGDVTAHIMHIGGDHAEDSSVIYIPQDNIAFLGDCLYEDLYHGPRNYTTQKLFPLLDKILSFKADFYLLGHEPPMPWEDMNTFASLLKTIGQDVEKSGKKREEILLSLKKTLDKSLDEDEIELVDAFLAGL